jgi:site-specific recombinase
MPKEVLGDRWFLRAVIGIGVIFVLNLLTSFSIAAYVAQRAYDVRLREQWGRSSLPGG